MKPGVWTRAGRSLGDGNSCVEARAMNGWIAIRDSKDRGGPVLVVDTAAWRAFLTLAKTSGG